MSEPIYDEVEDEGVLLRFPGWTISDARRYVEREYTFAMPSFYYRDGSVFAWLRWL